MYFTKKERVVIIVVACFVAILSFFKIFNPDTKDEDIIKNNEKIGFEEDDLQNEVADEEKESNIETSIIIHIAGQVKNPGILELKSGDRVIDAVELSGGLTDEADIKSINLARKLNDEEKIYIPREGETTQEDIVGNRANDIDSNNPSGMIDINICSKEELMTLPGIGDKTADKILDYRKENIFKSIEDIKNVSGIGDKKYEAIKDMIKVN